MQITRTIYSLLLKHLAGIFCLAIVVFNVSVFYFANSSLDRQSKAQYNYILHLHKLDLRAEALNALTPDILAVKVINKDTGLSKSKVFGKSWHTAQDVYQYDKLTILITRKSVLSGYFGHWVLFNLSFIIILLVALMFSHYDVYKHWKYLIQLELWAARFAKNNKFKFYIKNKDYQLINSIRELNKQRVDAQKGGQKADHFIRSQTFLDSSTSLGNRLYFEHRLDSVLQQDDKVYGAVMIIHYGSLEVVKEVGTEQEMQDLLLQFADILKNYVDDTAQSILSRISATEFALLLPLVGGDEVEKIAINVLRMSQKVRLPDYVDSNTVCHIGVDMYDVDNTSFQIMAEADMALRAAQLHGPSGWFMYDSGELPASEIRGSVRWRTTIENALEFNLFNMSFQPVVNGNMRINHHEVLARMGDGKGESISAKVFLPMAKKCGLIPEIDKKILSLVVSSLEPNSPSPISVNIHIDSWLNREFCNWLLQFLKQYKESAKRLIFEISEYELAQHARKLSSVFAAIRRFNVQLMVDQVGLYVLETAYLDYIQVEHLKLHQSIVHRINETPENQMFIRSLQTVANEKSISIFAMGVESEQEISTLKRMGVKGLQGHYIKRPVDHILPANDVVEIDGDNLDL
ncbi:MAG: EAL domain-containing protein [Gammaproteobacteria bacterium]|nr:EAL domain-containing protein [Gammaproteobacteria bacterium]